MGAIILAGAGDVFYWYRQVRREPAYAQQVPRIKWNRKVDRAYNVFAPPLAGRDGTVYVASGGTIHALDASSAERWQYRLESEDAIMAGRMVEDAAGNLYFAGLKRVYSLTSSGEKRWQAECPRAMLATDSRGEPFADDMLFTTCDTHVVGLSKRDGSEQWRLPQFELQPGIIPQAPVLLNDGKIVVTRNQRIVVTDHQGNMLWEYPEDGSRTTNLLGMAADGTLYTNDFVGQLAALDGDGHQKWVSAVGEGMGFTLAPVSAQDGGVYEVSSNGILLALDPDGSVKWQFAAMAGASADLYSKPVVGRDGTIYQLRGNFLFAISAMGKKIWRLELPVKAVGLESMALADDGSLYALMGDAQMLAIQTSSYGATQ